MLEECGARYDLVLVDIRDEIAKADPDFRAASPMGKVPALCHGAVKFTDSAAICAYLAEAYPHAGLAPTLGEPIRGLYLQWMVFAPGYIEPGMAEGFGSTRPNRQAHGWGDFPSVLDMLEAGLNNGPWLLGEQFTAADVMVGSSANFMRMFGLLKPDERPRINAYIDRCLERPAYQTALKLDTAQTLS